jgi:NAD(P)H-dependent FMN reductase
VILLLPGTVRPGARTRAAVDEMARVLRASGMQCLVWDLAMDELPIADPLYHEHPEDHPHPAVRKLVAAARSASGFVLASPVYHNSFSGVLKNCLDHLSIPEFASKPVGLIAFGRTLTAIQVCDHLRIVVRGLHGLALATQVVLIPDDFDLQDDGGYCLVSTNARRRMQRMAKEMRLYSQVSALMTAHAAPHAARG